MKKSQLYFIIVLLVAAIVLMLIGGRFGLPGLSGGSSGTQPDSSTVSSGSSNTGQLLADSTEIPPDSLSLPDEPAPLRSARLRVIKRDGKLIYFINDHETNDYIYAIRQIQPDTPVLLELGGNLLFAEEKAIKNALEAANIRYIEAE